MVVVTSELRRGDYVGFHYSGCLPILKWQLIYRYLRCVGTSHADGYRQISWFQDFVFRKYLNGQSIRILLGRFN